MFGTWFPLQQLSLLHFQAHKSPRTAKKNTQLGFRIYNPDDQLIFTIGIEAFDSVLVTPIDLSMLAVVRVSIHYLPPY